MDILFTDCLFLCPQNFCNGYLRFGLTQGNEDWQDGRPGWLAGHLLFTILVNLVVSPQGQKVKCIGQSRTRYDELAGDDAASS